VSYAKALCGEVQFSAEDAARSDPGYLCEVMSAAVDAGATVVNVPDTVGYSTPGEYGALVRRVVETPGIKSRARVSAHCHNDLGLAVANSLAAVLSGARQVECTINGIGERAGNAALEEVVMALQTREDLFRAHTGVATAELVGTSRMVADCLQMTIPPNKAIVGANAFAHEAGIHQDGVLKNPATYEIMNPATVGWTGTNLVLGKHSGRNALRMAIADRFGVQLTDDELRSAFDAFKNIADTRHLVTDPELRAIVHQCLAISTSVSPSYSQNEMRAEAENI
jgi:2-isopropylmalate synthase